MTDDEIKAFIEKVGYKEVQKFLNRVADDCFGKDHPTSRACNYETAHLCVSQYLTFKK